VRYPVALTVNKSLFLALLVIGVVLLVLGVIASDSISSGFSRLFTGEPTDKTLWLLIGGGVATIGGLGGLAGSK
jgi:hypothetical protein